MAGRGRAAPEPDAGPRNVTRKAAERAAELGVDVSLIDKTGFVTAEDVEAFAAAGARATAGPAEPDVVLDGLSLENVTLPAIFSVGTDEGVGVLDEEFLARLRADPAAFGALSSDERCEAYRSHGASIGEGVVLGAGTTIVAPRIVLEDGVEIGAHSIVRCEEVFAAGEIAWFGESLKLTCRRAFIGAGTWIAGDVQVGGGGHRDPWATFVIGELGFMGGEAFVNVCRPVVIGREAFLTMRSVLLTHNIGHSVLEGFENRFAGVVLEDRAQIGVGAVVYAGCRIGREAIVVSNSYVVNDVQGGTLAGGVPARTIGHASRAPSRARQVELARRIVDQLEEVLRLRGVETASLADDARGVRADRGRGAGARLVRRDARQGLGDPRRRRRDGGAHARRGRKRTRGRRRARPARAPRHGRGRRAARLRPRVLPQARDPLRARAVAVPGRPRLAPTEPPRRPPNASTDAQHQSRAAPACASACADAFDRSYRSCSTTLPRSLPRCRRAAGEVAVEAVGVVACGRWICAHAASRPVARRDRRERRVARRVATSPFDVGDHALVEARPAASSPMVVARSIRQ